MSANVKLKLKPVMVPNFVQLDTITEGNVSTAIPIAMLDHDALEELAYDWLLGFYKKAGKTCPFYKPAKDLPA